MVLHCANLAVLCEKACREITLIILNQLLGKFFPEFAMPAIDIFLFTIIVFSAQPSGDESSSDEGSDQPSPAFRRRRARKKTMSTSESEERLPGEQEAEPPKELTRRQFSSGLNKCVILALVVAISMGFGHFYGKYFEKLLTHKQCFEALSKNKNSWDLLSCH